MNEFWSGVPIGIGVIVSAISLILSLRKSQTETVQSASDIKDTIVEGYDKLCKALIDENKRLTDRIEVLQEEVKGLRQEIITLRGDLNVERLKNEASVLTRRLDASAAENAELKRAGAVVPPQRAEDATELKKELNHTNEELEKARDVQQDSAQTVAE